MNTEQIKQYIEENIDLIDQRRWEKFFENAPRGIGGILHEAGIDFMSELGCVPHEAFLKSNIKTIDIPESVTSIGDYAFCMCSALTSITIPENVTNMGSYTFYKCSKLTNITIPDGVTNIGDWVFAWCESLANVTIGNNVTSIGYDAFNGCISLTSITIPDNVTNIGEYAFLDCSSLTNVTMSNNITAISNYAFSKCGKLEIKYDGTTIDWKNLIGKNNTIFRDTQYICNCIDGIVNK